MPLLPEADTTRTPQLLSAVLEHEHQLDTVSWSLQKFPELNYIELARAPSPEQLASVQQRCNDLIGQARPIRVKFELATDETGVKLGDHVPSDYRAGEQGDERPPVQRTVIIDELDENPCVPDGPETSDLSTDPFAHSLTPPLAPCA